MSEKKLSVAERLYTGQLSYDFMKNRKKWFTFSAVLIVATLAVLFGKGLTLGIEFEGGTDFQAHMTIGASTVDDVRSHLNELSVDDLGAQVSSLGSESIRVQTRSLTLKRSPPPAPRSPRSRASSPGGHLQLHRCLVGQADLAERGHRARGVHRARDGADRRLLPRLEDVGGGHRRRLPRPHRHGGRLRGGRVHRDPSTVIGVLTILGYSLYDTVVVFDKIRENVRGLEHTNRTYSEQANRAVNQVLVRSLNTTVIGVLPVLALFIAGTALQSGPLADLSLALLVGMIAGAYSSIFIAAPCWRGCVSGSRRWPSTASRSSAARPVPRRRRHTASRSRPWGRG
ncbi:protein translocase subunit SecF [Tessaracoccus coleopterorum]|nr:protein translocase subunit SecF [Tessaracoccus coleopterorum]